MIFVTYLLPVDDPVAILILQAAADSGAGPQATL